MHGYQNWLPKLALRKVWGRCVGSAAHSPLHAIAARTLSTACAIEPRPTHFTRVCALGVPRTHNAARALCVGSRTLCGPAHFAWVRALCVGPRILRGLAHFATRARFLMQISTHSICYPSKSRPILSKPIQFLAATKQLYKWYFPSVRLSVCPSVCPSVCLSHLFDYVPIIVSSWNFQELLPMTKVRSLQKVKVRGQRSRSQRSQPNLTVSGL